MKNDIIRFENNVPDNYLVGSRDYQALLRLFTFGISSIKFDVDNIRYVNDASHINSRLLNLLKLKVGFFTKEEFKDQYIREVLKVFSLIVKKKGTRQAIYDAINLYFRACRYNGDYVVEINNKDDIQPYMIRIGVTKESNDILLLEEILKYILPTGYLYEVFKYSTAKYKSNYYSQDIVTLSVVDDYNGSNIHSNSSNIFIEKLYEGISVGPAPIITITDGAENTPLKSAVVNIEPVQDLHGYDYPWPAGGGKNLLALNLSPARTQALTNVTVSEQTENKVTFVSSSNTYACLRLFYHLKAGTYTLSIKGTASDSYTPTVSVYYYSSPYALIAGSITQAEPKSFTLSTDADVDIRFFATGSTAVVRTVTYSEVQLELGSTATAYAPYSNICPISGWTQCDGVQVGKNFCPQQATTVNHGVTFTANSDGGYTLSGTANGNGVMDIGRGLWTLPAGTYYVSLTGTSNAQMTTFKVVNGAATYINSGNGVFTLTETTGVFVRLLITSGTMASGKAYVQVESGSLATTFAPYQGTPITTPLGRTVYGGTLDVVRGKLVVDRAMADMGSLTWTYNTSWASFGVFTSDSLNSTAKTFESDTKLVCSDYAQTAQNASGNAVTVAYMSEGQIQIKTASKQIYVRDSRYTSASAFKTAMSGVQLVYPLATTIEVDLTPQTIKTLLGVNNIWCNTGNTSLEYLSEASGGSYITYYNVYNNVTDDYINILTYPSVDDIELYNGDFTVSVSETDFDLDNANMYVLIHQYLKDDRIVCSNTTWSISYDAQTDSITATSGNNEINISYSNFIRNLPLLEDHEIPSSFTLVYENESISTEGFVLQDDNRSFTFTGYDGNKIIVKYETDSQYLGKRIDNVVVYKNGWENESD